jgi:hypothetical protein
MGPGERHRSRWQAKAQRVSRHTRSRSQHETEQLLMFGKRQQRQTKRTAAT